MGNLGVSQIDSVRVQKKAQVQQQAQTRQESVSFFDEAWSGHQIAKLTGDNFVTDWLQDKDKVCTDGKDDGELSLWEGTKSLAKGLIGGIPKAMINHPLATAVTVGLGAAATVLTSGAILPVLGAIGVVTGIGMVGYGTYKSATAETDGEAKQALETLGMGVTTTALSMASAGKTLEKAAEAGVKSAQVSEDANIFQKTIQMFKAIPESLTKSKEWTLSYIKGTPVNIELANGTKQVKVKGKLIEETFENGAYKKYDAEGNIIKELVVNENSKTLYENGVIKEETFSNGGYKKYDADGVLTEGKVIEGNKTSYYAKGKLLSTREDLPNGDKILRSYTDGELSSIREDLPNGGYKVYDADGVFKDGIIIEGNKKSFYSNGKLEYVREELPNGECKVYDANGVVTDGAVVEGNKTSYYENGKLLSTTEKLPNGGYKKYDADGVLILTREELPNGGYKLYDGNGTLKIVEGNKVSVYENGKLVSITDGKMKKTFNPNGSIKEIIFHEYEHVTKTTKYNPDGTRTEIFRNIYQDHDKVSTFDKLGRLVKFEDYDGVHEYYYEGEGYKKVAEYYTRPHYRRSSVTRIYDGTADLSTVKRGEVILDPNGVELIGYEFGKPLPEVSGGATKVVINPDGKWRAYSNGVNIESWGLSLEEHRPSASAMFGHEPFPGITYNDKPVYSTSDFSPSEIEVMKNNGYKERPTLGVTYLYKD